MKYDMKGLDSGDFEKLIRDILQKKNNHCHIERFGVGKDGGIDLRFKNNNKNIVVQCKHYANSTVSNLIRTFEKTELPKVKKLKPDKYMIATSLKLSPFNKDELMSLMKPFIKHTEDIWGGDEINDYISDYSDIEKRHYKLWFNSIIVLREIMNAQFYIKTKLFLNKIKQKVDYFIEPDIFDESYDMLNKENYCIIAGNPGIGKSTLAEILLLKYFKEHYEVIKVDNISDIHSVYNEESKQIFYYDDFLGSTELLFDINSAQGQNLYDFLANITKGSSNTKLLVTAREYILNSAKLYAHNMKRYLDSKYMIKMNEQKNVFNAHVLVKYLINSKIKYKNFLDENKFYHIVKHNNFSPRIVDHLISNYNTGEDLYLCFKKALENPELIWKEAFEKLNMNNKIVLYIFIISDRGFSTNELLKKYNILNKLNADYYNYPLYNGEFKDILKILIPMFLDTNTIGNGCNLVLVNPGLEDFLKNSINQRFDNKDFHFMLNIIETYDECINLITKTKILLNAKHNDTLKNEVFHIIYNVFTTGDIETSNYVTTYNFLLELLGFQEMLLSDNLVPKGFFKKDLIVCNTLGNILDFIIDNIKEVNDKEILFDIIEIIFNTNILKNNTDLVDKIYNFYIDFNPETVSINHFYLYCKINKLFNRENYGKFYKRIKSKILSEVEDNMYYSTDIDFNQSLNIDKLKKKLYMIDEYFNIDMNAIIIEMDEHYKDYLDVLDDARGLWGNIEDVESYTSYINEDNDELKRVFNELNLK